MSCKEKALLAPLHYPDTLVNPDTCVGFYLRQLYFVHQSISWQIMRQLNCQDFHFHKLRKISIAEVFLLFHKDFWIILVEHFETLKVKCKITLFLARNFKSIKKSKLQCYTILVLKFKNIEIRQECTILARKFKLSEKIKNAQF